ncbi:adenylate/guanylate cyclase domain-containing protein [Cellvibrio mixtus]|uniref:Adenylate/guanylate cyclase domain-containing protein n=1 Tax=Cellvibrio mixtus TaxID=39650 RepID=A0A266Q4G8_9GAMM|nr:MULTISPECIES: adenylate/guanylate cyclase domain-containing protein [Cellvibrio]AQT59210.1 adenylate/guanylate cyclase domain-containing protein [Cellvibrio sp. PSBB023]OZY84763.1 adenylate/guanylate cyclase domain-containing protein [Cellvibrio mixtus]
MTQYSQPQAIMFADVSGSSALYKRLGNEQAKAIIDESVQFMTALTIVHEGTLVKTIGDEIMARFDKADQACEAAIAIQLRAIKEPHLKDLGIRIGIAFGEVLITADDAFGDNVNDAACVAQIARANQIVITQSTVDALDQQLRRDCQMFDRINIKGDQEETIIYRLQWEHTGNNSRTTIVIPIEDITSFAEKFQLSLQVNGARVFLLPEQTPFAIGRDTQKAQLHIESEFASREHCHIEFRRGKYVLVDHSTNGTYVYQEEQAPIYLRREELPLQGRGFIGLGQTLRGDNPWAIHFAL